MGTEGLKYVCVKGAGLPPLKGLKIKPGKLRNTKSLLSWHMVGALPAFSGEGIFHPKGFPPNGSRYLSSVAVTPLPFTVLNRHPGKTGEGRLEFPM